MAEHAHSDGPFRCCEDEPAERVLRKLKANPPERLGRRMLPPGHPDGPVTFGETQEAFEQRRAAWHAAIAREEALA